MNIAVVDDSKAFVNDFCVTIKNYCEKHKVESMIDPLYDGFTVLENYSKYDLIFLDIDMPLIDGIEIAKRINEAKNKSNIDIPYIVFVTNKDNLVFTALRLFPYAFIRKNHFSEDIEKCIVSINQKLSGRSLRYPVKTGRSTRFLNFDEILYLEKDKNYVIFHTFDSQYRERTNIDEKLKDLSSMGFIRPHIGYLVNQKYVSEVSGTEILLINGQEIPISKSYKQSVKKQYFDWMVKRDD